MKRNLRNLLLASFLLAGVPLAAHVANADDKSMGMGGGMHGDMGGGMGMVPFGKRAEKLATELGPLLLGEKARAVQIQELKSLRSKLGSVGATSRVVDHLRKYIEHSPEARA